MTASPILFASELRAADAAAIAAGIPGIVLMETAAHGVVDYLQERFAPLAERRVVIFCGKGNNGGDGLALARQIQMRFSPRSLDVLLACKAEELSGDAAANLRMWLACGGAVEAAVEPRMQLADLVIDALLGTGIEGPARGLTGEWIDAINTGFPFAKVVAVDLPSGMPSDSGDPAGRFARADATVTFSALKPCQVFAPNSRKVGELRLVPIGGPLPATSNLALIEPATFRGLLGPRDPGGNKGRYGHVLAIAGAAGKTGAAVLCGTAALKCGAGLVTVVCDGSGFPPELMAEPTAGPDRILELLATRSVAVIGPGLGTAEAASALVHRLFAECEKPLVLDADALNILSSGEPFTAPPSHLRVLTPHPGEMSRLLKVSIARVQSDRLGSAHSFSAATGCVTVLKGDRTLIAFPDGTVWVNPTGSPAMATGGTGDVLAGMIAGMLAQHPNDPKEAVAAAVYLHGLAGQIGAGEIGEMGFVASDLFRFLPAAIKECQGGPQRLYRSNRV